MTAKKTLREREFHCSHDGCDVVSVGLAGMTEHALTHGRPVTAKPSPMWFYVSDGNIVGEALDMEAALAMRDEFPGAELIFHLALKKRVRRDRGRVAGTNTGERSTSDDAESPRD